MSSNIVPFFTVINAKEGVKVNSTINSDYESVVSVSIDSEYLERLVQSKVESLGGLSDSDRLDLTLMGTIFAQLGIKRPSTIVVAPVDDSETPAVGVTFAGPVLTGPLSFKFKVVTNTNDVATERRLTFGAGSTPSSVISGLKYAVLRNQAAVKYLKKFYLSSDGAIHYDWYDKFTKFRLEIQILLSESADEVSFSII